MKVIAGQTKGFYSAEGVGLSPSAACHNVPTRSEASNLARNLPSCTTSTSPAKTGCLSLEVSGFARKRVMNRPKALNPSGLDSLCYIGEGFTWMISDA